MEIVKITAECKYPTNPWDAIYKAVHDLLTKGVKTSEIKISCSELVQRYLRAMMLDLDNIKMPYGMNYESIMFMGITFENYPYNTEILIYTNKACYYPELCVKLPLEFSTKEKIITYKIEKNERGDSKSAD